MKQVVRYLAIIQTPEFHNEAWGVFVPDIPGCFSAGDTLNEALNNVREAIEFHIEGLIEMGDKIPESSDLLGNSSRKMKRNETAYLVDFDSKSGHLLCSALHL